MKPDFSEFSYGYAVTEELMTLNEGNIIGSPVFPSLYEEGKIGGYDVKIPMVGTPIFLQFKLSHYLSRKNSKEIKNGLFSSPYYRMHIRPAKHSNQHELLRSLESSGENVFYIAPEFHSISELNSSYLSSSIISNSVIFSPNEIGKMPDNKEHYMVFTRGNNEAYRCSDEAKLIKKHDLKNGLSSLLEMMGVKERKINEEEFERIGIKMINSLSNFKSEIKYKPIDIDGAKKILQQVSPYISVPYIAHTLFDSQLVIV